MKEFQWADPYPLMNSLGKSEGPIPDLEEHYKGQQEWKYEYYQEDEYFYDDSNFHSNPFSDPDDQSDTSADDAKGHNPMKRSNSYEVLGISEDSDDEDIKKAFRSKAKVTHPDRGGDPADFRAVREAYEILIQ